MGKGIKITSNILMLLCLLLLGNFVKAQAPSISAHPSNDTVCQGNAAYFLVTASNTNSYQWQVNSGSGWSNLSNSGGYGGVTTDSMYITSTATSMHGYLYRCIATGSSSPAATSNSATLYVSGVTGTTNDTVCSGGNGQLIASKTSIASAVKWYTAASGGSLLSTGDTLTVSSATTTTTYYAEAQGGSSGSGSDSLATPYNTNNGQRGAMFDVQTGSNPITVTSFDCNLYSGTTANYEIWYRPSTFVGYENSSTGWTQLGTVTSLTSLGNNVATPIPISFSVTIPANTRYSFYITNDYGGGTSYTDGAAVGNYLAGNSDATIYEGVGKSYPFGLTFTVRKINATMHYYVGGSCSSASRVAATLTVNPQANITASPSNSTITSGNNTSFSITASSATSYQWQVNNGGGWSNVTNTGIYSGATTTTLSLTSVSSGYNNYQYRCIATNSSGCADTSGGATLFVSGTAPSISAHPSNSTICSGSNTSFSVTASGTSLTYQWQVNSGSGWSSVTNTGIYSGATTSTLTLTSVSSTYNTYQYRCVVTGSVSPAATSNAATLTVNTAPSVSAHPSNSTICSGSNTSFSVTASGTSLSYLWQVNSGSGWSSVTNTGIYSGATTSTLSLTGATAAYSTYQYRCVVSGTCSPSATSNAAMLTVNTAPSISAQPSNSTICSGNNTSFSVTANGTSLSYQWQVNTGSGWSSVTNAGIYSGATTSTLSLTGATATYSTYQYRCVVSGTCSPSATSNAATLTVNTAPSVSASPSNSTICSGSNTSFIVTANGTSLSYQWQVNTGSGWSSVTNTGIYSGATTSTLSLTGATATYSTYQYRCVVSGTCSSSATSNAATLTINTAPSISVHPANSTIGAGSNTSFNVTASGTGLTYQWQVNSGSGWSNVTNTGIYSGATSATLGLTSVTSTYNTYQYRCIVSGTCSPSTTSNVATLTVNSAPAITAQPSNSTICNGQNTSFSVTAVNATGYQWQVNSGSGWSNVTNTGIYSGATSSTLTLTGATTSVDGYQYRCEVTGLTTPNAVSNAATLTINIAPSISAHPSNSTICSGSNTSFSVTAAGAGLSYQWQVNSGSGWSNVTNTGIYNGATSSSLSLTAATSSVNTYQYRCVVSGTCPPSVTSNAAVVTINTAPSISVQPSNSTICSGSNTSFIVTASGTGLTYQWQVNSGSGWSSVSNTGIYSGATTSTLSLAGATISVNTYQYRCMVSGTCSPTATSNTATLTINTAPSISAHPSNSTICSGSNTSFSVTASGTGLSYQWQINSGSGWSNVTNTGIYTGATSSSLSLTTATSSVNMYQYRCVVSGTCAPSATSNAATITINSAPSISVQPTNVTINSGNNTSFSVTAGGTSLSYQWQVNSGSGWSNVTNTGIYSGATSSTLSLTGATATQNGYQYRCIVSGTCSPSATSNAATLTVNSAAGISSHPSNSTICAGGNTTFTVVASSAVSYQWQVNSGSGWSNVTNTGIYSGATTANLALTGVTNSEDGYQYRCQVTGAAPPDAISNAAILTVNVAPAITTNPVNRTICEGTDTYYSIVATGTSLTYQWQMNSGSGWSNLSNTGIYSGATADTLRLTAVPGSVSTYQYRCIVGGACSPSATSNAVNITVNNVPAITVQPSNSTICNNQNTSFSVTAKGTGLTYQWQVNSGSGWSNLSNTSIYSGATASILSLTSATTSIDGYQYRCVVSGTCSPAATSNAVTLNINTAPSITLDPVNSTVCDGGNTSFGITATGNGLTYQWQVNSGSSWSNVANTGIYSGAATSTLSLTSVTAASDGNQYRCVVNGSCTPADTSDAAILTINSLLTINNQPSNSTICSGNNTSFSVTASASGLTYQWQMNSGSGWSNVTNTGIYSGATASTLTLTGATTAANGNQYRCALTSTCAAPTNSNAATLTVNVAPSITTQPVSSTICQGSNTSFAIAATGSSVTYQWEVNSGSGWGNVTNGGIYSGATTNTLNLTAPAASLNGNQYRCIVGGVCVPGVTSNTATLTINVAPSLSVQPVNSTICSGNNIAFVVNATGTSLAYQWQVNSGSGWGNVANTGIYNGATTDTLVLTSATTSVDGYQYRCHISGVCTPDVTSNTATLTVNSAPAITTQPVSSTICLGSSTSFSILAAGASLTYQWQVNAGSGWSNVANNAVYSGAATSTLSLNTPAVSYSTYQYRCIIGGSCVPGVTSSTVTLTVNTAPSLNVQPVNSTICSGNNTIFAVSATGTSLVYQWQVNAGSGWSNVANTGIYSGATSDTLKLTAATTSVNSYQYRCQVSGVCTPNVTSNTATLTVNTAPSVTTQPVNSTICSGNSTSFSIVATGTALTYQWQVNSGSGWSNVSNNAVYSGAATSTLSLTTPAVLYSTNQYRCIIGGSCVPGVTSNAVTLTINTAPSISTQPTNSTICAGNNTAFVVNAAGTNLVYQWQVNSGSGWSNVTNTGIYGGATTDSLTLTAATTVMNGNQYRCQVNGVCTPNVTSGAATLTVNTAPSISAHPANRTICEGNNTTFSITASGTGLTYQWEVNSGSGWSNVSNTGIYGGATTNTLSLTGATTTVNTYQYRCKVGGVCVPGVTSNSATLIINTAPVVTTQPNNSTICSGNNTSFSVIATGTGLTYQWQMNSGSGWSNVTNTGIYSGATGSTLTLTAATTTNNGCQYRCVVSGTCTPSVTSAGATLTVNELPAITGQPSSSTICEGSNTSFSVSATGTGLTYQWQVNSGSSWSNVTNTGIYTGATTNKLILTTATTAVHNYDYRCVVGGTCTPAVVSNVVSLTINTSPVITSQPANKTICEGLNHTFNISATGTGLTYQWQVNSGSSWNNVTNNSVYSGATASALTLSNIPPSYTGNQYRCTINGTCVPPVTSSAVTLTVHANPVVSTQPVKTNTICSGDNTGFSLSATGTGLGYQWKVYNGSSWSNVTNNSIYSGATTSSLTITGPTAATTAITYKYYCFITGTCANTNSDTSTLTINARPAITSNPSNKAVCDSTDNILFAIDATGTNLDFQWQINPGTGWSNLINNSTYTGTKSKQLKITEAHYNMNGHQFRCVVSGTCTPVVTSSTATLTVYPLKTPAVTINATSTDICVGTSVTLTPTPVNGGTNPGYVWQLNGTTVSTGTTYSTTTFADNDTIVCIMTSKYVCPTPPTATSNTVKMKVTPYSKPTITISSPTGNKGCLGRPVYFYSQTTHGGPMPTYNWQVNGTPAGANIDTFTSNSLQNGDKVKCIFTSSIKCPDPKTVTSNDIIMDIIPVTKASIVIAATDTAICSDDKVTIYTWFINGGTTPKYQWVRNGTDMPGETQASLVTTALQNNDVIECRFTSSARCVFPELSNDISFDVDPILTPEVGVTGWQVGANTFTFKALPTNGGANPQYQWFKNGHMIKGATDSMYTANDLGKYDRITVRLVSSIECVSNKVAMSRYMTTGVEDEELSKGVVKIYPNPNKGRFFIKLPAGTGEGAVLVSDMSGRVIKHVSFNGNKSLEINMGDVANGTYMVVVRGDNIQYNEIITKNE